MINTLLGKVFGTKNEREVKRLQPRVAAINALEPAMQKLSDDELRAKTAEFRARIQERLSSIADEPGRPIVLTAIVLTAMFRMPLCRTPSSRILTGRRKSKTSAAKRSRKCSTNCWRKRLLWFARLEGACSTCGTSTCS